ncbi:hypothetical protein PO124_25860 [Bacillus licheniformis]|nr:hypothetical protein [Bacillus licheniformis]
MAHDLTKDEDNIYDKAKAIEKYLGSSEFLMRRKMSLFLKETRITSISFIETKSATATIFHGYDRTAAVGRNTGPLGERLHIR